MKDFFHILNPSRRYRSAVRKKFRKIPMDYYCWVERKSHPTHIETLTEWAVREGKNKIAVWGGDGSFSRVVQELYRLKALDKMEVALIPVGTANDFARKLGWKSWKKLASQIFSGKKIVKNFDLGLVQNGEISRIFVNNSGFGRKIEALKKVRSNPLKDIFNFNEHKLEVEWKTDHVTQYETFRAILGIVFNGPFFNNGMYFSKDVSADDGVLSAFFAPPQNKARLFKKFVLARLGRSLNDKETVRLDGGYFSVESDVDMYPQADGEPILNYGVRELSYSILKGVLRLAMGN